MTTHLLIFSLTRGFIKVLSRREFGVGTEQSLFKALKILKIYSCRDAKSRQAKLSSQLINLPGAWPLIKPLTGRPVLGFSISFNVGGESSEIDGEGADISHFICMV